MKVSILGYKNILVLMIDSELYNSAFPQNNSLIVWFIFSKVGCSQTLNGKTTLGRYIMSVILRNGKREWFFYFYLKIRHTEITES